MRIALSLETSTDTIVFGAPMQLEQPFVIVGRTSQCDIQIADASIAKRHCALIEHEGCVFLCDLSSTGGTYVVPLRESGQGMVEGGESRRAEGVKPLNSDHALVLSHRYLRVLDQMREPTELPADVLAALKKHVASR